MAVTVKVNGTNLSLVHKGSSGISAATLPDVCKTPPGPVPVPYPNVSRSATLVKGTTTVHADGGMMIAIKGSEFATSTGDEAGVAGGVKSGTFMKESTWITYSFDVKMEGAGTARLTDKKFQNHGNTVDAAGVSQFPLDLITSDPVKYVLCQIHCEILEEVESGRKPLKSGEKFSHRAQSIGEGKYKGALDNAAKKLLGEGAEAALEKTTKVAVQKGAVSAGKRALMSAATIERRIRNELLEAAAVKAGKRMAAKVFLKFIPIVNAASLAWDVYEIGTAAYEISKAVGDFMSKYDVFRIRPDAMVTGADGRVKIYDHKFPGDSFGNNPGQEELYKKATGEQPGEISKKECGGCKKKLV